MKIISAEQYNRFKADTWLPMQNFYCQLQFCKLSRKMGNRWMSLLTNI